MTTSTPNHRPGSPPPTVWASIRSHHAPALIDWLVDVAGFRRNFVAQHGDVVEHAQLGWPEGGGVMVGSVRPDTQWRPEPGGAGCYVVTDNPDAVYQRVRASGAPIVDELHETDYGNREFSCADPDGNHWSFGWYRGEPVEG